MSTELTITKWEGYPLALKYLSDVELMLIYTQTRELCDIAYERALKKDPKARPVDDSQIYQFILTAAYLKLNPLKKQIYAIPRGDKLTNQTSIDGLRAIAHRTGQCTGIETYRHEEKGGLINATAVVCRNGHEFKYTAWRKEYYPSNDYGTVWREKAGLMLEKCAEAGAHRRAFPEEMLGLYIDEEMPRAEIVIPHSETSTVPVQTPVTERQPVGESQSMARVETRRQFKGLNQQSRARVEQLYETESGLSIESAPDSDMELIQKLIKQVIAEVQEPASEIPA